MKLFLIFISVILFSGSLLSRATGETEITTEEGIEVFQNEKYYLLKKNVKIESDTFELIGDRIKIFFDKDLYDIRIIDAEGNVKLDSNQYNIKADSEKLVFTVNDEIIKLKGANSKLITNETEMYSDGRIEVNNINGDFYLFGPNSKMIAEDIFIQGNLIEGVFDNSEDGKSIKQLNVVDEKIAYVKTENTEMYANKLDYDENTSLIILEDNVKIIRDGETITGDYGTLDTNTNSYKVRSKNSQKVKVVIKNNE